MRLLLYLSFILIATTAHSSERLKQILLSAPDHYYVVQVASFKLDTDLSKPQRNLMIDRTLVAVKTLVEGEQRWSILSGIFPNRTEAMRHVLVLRKRYPQLSPSTRSVKLLRDVLVTDEL